MAPRPRDQGEGPISSKTLTTVGLDRGKVRLLCWLGVTSVLLFTLYSSPLSLLLSGLNTLLSTTLGTVFPAYPFLGLLVVLTAVRWRDFHRVLQEENGLTSKPRTRVAGLVLILAPIGLWYLFIAQLDASGYLAMEVAACSLVSLTYGTLIAINPSMWRVMLPYASLYGVGLVSPLFLVETLGGPLAAFSSYVAAWMTQALGLHVVWQGASFAFVSALGEPISSVVTPACSAVYSISIYLGLLGLMYLDMRSSFSTILKFAVFGVALIPILDSARIAIMIWFGFTEGSGVFWGIHDWLGYAMFFAFYIAALAAYSRAAARYAGPTAVASLA